jgi:hypothetical protein
VSHQNVVSVETSRIGKVFLAQDALVSSSIGLIARGRFFGRDAFIFGFLGAFRALLVLANRETIHLEVGTSSFQTEMCGAWGV